MFGRRQRTVSMHGQMAIHRSAPVTRAATADTGSTMRAQECGEQKGLQTLHASAARRAGPGRHLSDRDVRDHTHQSGGET